MVINETEEISGARNMCWRTVKRIQRFVKKYEEKRQFEIPSISWKYNIIVNI
jgi:hypothetical protein